MAYRVSASANQIEATLPLLYTLVALAVDPRDHALWALTNRYLYRSRSPKWCGERVEAQRCERYFIFLDKTIRTLLPQAGTLWVRPFERGTAYVLSCYGHILSFTEFSSHRYGLKMDIDRILDIARIAAGHRHGK